MNATAQSLNPLTEEGYAQLNATVDNVLAIHGVRAQVSEEVASQFEDWRPRKSSVDGSEPWLMMANARAYLADTLTGEKPGEKFSEEEIAARTEVWWNLRELQECFLSGKTDQCIWCGEMEGQHYPFGICRRQDLVNQGGGVLSQTFSRIR